jgi:hypothetical protein
MATFVVRPAVRKYLVGVLDVPPVPSKSEQREGKQPKGALSHKMLIRICFSVPAEPEPDPDKTSVMICEAPAQTGIAMRQDYTARMEKMGGRLETCIGTDGSDAFFQVLADELDKIPCATTWLPYPGTGLTPKYALPTDDHERLDLGMSPHLTQAQPSRHTTYMCSDGDSVCVTSITVCIEMSRNPDLLGRVWIAAPEARATES